MDIRSDIVPKPLAKQAKAKGFTLRPVRAHKLLDWLRGLGIDITSFPIVSPAGKQYRFYATGPNGKLCNPVHRNSEGKITGYEVAPDYKTGLHDALANALTLLD